MKKITGSFLTCALVLMLMGTTVSAQQAGQADKAEQAAKAINSKVMNDLIAHTGMTAVENDEFNKYYSIRLATDKVNLFKNIMNGQLNKATALQYVQTLENTYEHLYASYQKAKAEFPQSINEVIHASHNPTGVCNPACDNMDLSSGTLTAWTECYAASTSSKSGSFVYTTPTCGSYLGTKGAYDATTGTNQVSIMSGGNDPVTNMPTVYPGMTHSVMVGDGPTANYGVAQLEQTFMVSASNAAFYYMYEPVLQYPSNHTYNAEPYFCVTFLDQNGDTIPNCGNYLAVSGTNTTNWLQTNYQDCTVYFQYWQTAYVSLKKYIGTCVTIIVRTSDCAEGAHFGYAYFASRCESTSITTSGPLTCNNPVTLTAPPGGAQYTWTGPCIIGSNTTPNIQVDCPGKYTVIRQTVMGGSCRDTLDTIINMNAGTSAVAGFTAATACIGSPTQFTNTTPLGSSYTYSWNFGDPASGSNNTSTLTNPTHIFSSLGTYTVSLQATNGTCVGNTTLSVLVNPSGVKAGFKADTVCKSLATTFTDTSKGNPVSWNWNFGDGYTSTLQNPTHIYYSTGTFTATLITGGGACADTAKRTVLVKAVSIPFFSAAETCIGKVTTFTNNSSPGTNTHYNWNLGDGTLSNDTNLTHTYASPGKYAVTLVAINTSGCSHTVTDTVKVDAKVYASYTVTGQCTNLTAVFTNTSTGPYTSYNFWFGDGSGALQLNPSHPYAAPGTYSTGLAIANGACQDTALHPVTVKALPTVAFKADTVCAGSVTLFTNTTTWTKGNTYSWNFGDGSATSPDTNVSHTYASMGTYKVVLTAKDSNGCYTSDTGKAIVSGNTVANFTATTACLGTPTVFTDKSTGTPLKWKWSFGDGNKSTSQNPSYTYAAAGNYTVTLVTGTGNCADSLKQTVTVSALPAATIMAKDTIQCQGITDTLIAGGGTTYVWSTGSTSSSLVISPATTTTYTVTATKSGCTKSVQAVIHINPTPVISITGDSIICAGNSTTLTASGANTYTWSPSGSTGSSIFISPASTTTYTIYGVSPQGCTGYATRVVNVTPSTGFDLTGNLSICIDTPSFSSASIQACIFNTRCQMVKGKLKLVLDTAFHITTTVSDSVAHISGDTLIWNYDSLSEIGKTHCVSLNGKISNIPTNDSVFVTMVISPSAGDAVPSNNSVTYWVKPFPYNCIGLPFDPNEKSVLPEGNISPTQKLTYTIEFQNTGTALAHNVVVVDTLSQYVDPTTLNVLSSSHEETTSIVSGNIVKFTFNNINLVDTATSKTSSIGVVKYTISPKNTAAAGDVIKNNAGIYFDANPVIKTNTTKSPIVGAPLSVNRISTSLNIACFPNPFTTATSIVFNTDGTHYIELDDVTGRKIETMECSGRQYELQRNNLAAGVYFIKAFDTEHKYMAAQKVVVQ